jgi:hypothetical protein
MPEHRTLPRLATVLVVACAVLLAAPAWAQTDEAPLAPSDDPEGRWTESTFDSPADGDVVRQADPLISGRFVYRKVAAAQRIVAATIEVHPDGFEPAPTCEPVTPQPVSAPDPEPDDYTAETTRLDFAVQEVRLECNGRYLIHATAQLNDGTRWSMQRRFAVEAPPAAPSELDADLDRAARTATITFTPLDATERTADEVGYVIERRGSDDDGWTDVATLEPDEEPTHVDDLADAGQDRYTYRARAVRAGVDEPVRSDPEAAPTAEVELVASTTSSTPEVRADRGSDRVRSRTATQPRRRTTTSRQAPPTTLDTGFEDTIDYGDREAGDALDGDEPVAGQSIVQDEAEGTGLAVPAAGALVLLGWAGHIVYLNRLAKQL